MQNKARKNEEIKSYLKKLFPKAEIELEFNSDFELLVAVILSAQCTDKRVNIVTRKLFENYNKPVDLAKISQEKLEEIIKPCGFYHNKATAIIETSKDILKKYNGVVPLNREDLMTLKGVGRKTANVVLSTLINFPAIAVDTHVFRVSKRLGISNAKNVIDCEKDLMNFFDKNDWAKLHYLLVLFGRYYCKAKNPKCESCELKQMCYYYINNQKLNKGEKDVFRQS